MKRRKFTEQQIAFALKQAELGTAVEEVCKKMGIADATFYNRKKKYGGLGPSELRRLRQLEKENTQLKKLVADLSLEKGKPTDNAKVESFNGRLRQECLTVHWFLSLDDAKAKIQAWRKDYNEVRPHSALQWMTPAEFACQERGTLCLTHQWSRKCLLKTGTNSRGGSADISINSEN
jgi:putative transposase